MAMYKGFGLTVVLCRNVPGDIQKNCYISLYEGQFSGVGFRAGLRSFTTRNDLFAHVCALYNLALFGKDRTSFEK